MSPLCDSSSEIRKSSQAWLSWILTLCPRSLLASPIPFSLFILLIGTFSPLTGLLSLVSTFLSDTIIKGHAFLEYVYRCCRLPCLQEPSYRGPILDKWPLISISTPQHGTFALIQSQGTGLLTTNY